jgi:hypothetical protein
MFQRVLISVAVVLAFALPATAEDKPAKEKEKSGKPSFNLNIGGKKDGVGVDAKIDPTKKDNPLSSLKVQIGGDKKEKEKEKAKGEKPEKSK